MSVAVPVHGNRRFFIGLTGTSANAEDILGLLSVLLLFHAEAKNAVRPDDTGGLLKNWCQVREEIKHTKRNDMMERIRPIRERHVSQMMLGELGGKAL